MSIVEFQKNNFTISTDPSLIQIQTVHEYLSKESYWAKDRPLEIVAKSIKNSLCFGVYTSNKQIGFSRIVTDYAVFAYILDLFILKKHQGQGLGKWLMSCMLSHPDLQSKMIWVLSTKDAHGLYKKHNFTNLSNPENWMTLDKRQYE